MLKTYYKKKWCKYGDNCKYAQFAYLCKFAHYAEEKKRIKFKKPLMSVDRCKNICLSPEIDENSFWKRMAKRAPFRCDIAISNEITIFHDNNVGLVQVLLLISNDNNINKLVVSYLLTHNNKSYIKTLDKCNRCSNIFSYKYDQDSDMHRYRRGLHLRNNPFYCAEYRKTCNIGPLCYGCALYKIPIRCDVCNTYTNANNMEFNYDIMKDTEMINLFKICAHRRHNNDVNKILVDKKSNACNICTSCLFVYYDSILPDGFTYCYQCYEEYIDIIDGRFGSVVRKSQWGNF